MTEESVRRLVDQIRTDFPGMQALYLYGSTVTGSENASSDLDLGLLLPHAEAAGHGTLALSDTRFALEAMTGRSVDLVNLRRVSIVLQKEVIATGRLIHIADRNAVEEYEMLVLSRYGKLNEERAEILKEFASSKRAYPV
jgi:predicted nucleotidyltransferase